MILASVQILSLIALIVYVIKTWHMASATKKSAEAAQRTLDELKETRDQETAPYVVTYFEASPESHIIFLIVKNIGKTTARDVKLRFDPHLKSSNQGIDMDMVSLIKSGIASMPPGYQIRTVFDSAISYFHANLPFHFTATISYSGGLRTDQRTYQQVLDLEALRGVTLAHEKGMHDLVTIVEKLVDMHSSFHTHFQEIIQALKKDALPKKAKPKKYGWRPKGKDRG